MYRTVTETELKKYGKTWSVSRQAIALVNHQKATWPLAGNNYRALGNVRQSEFQFGHFRVKYQFNPERIRSSAANTGREAILARPCFLCARNLPPEQCGIPVSEHYIILTNPYPIFPYHLTIPSREHVPQQLKGNINNLLDISKLLSEFVVLYNGPQCGASAPDHFHFQAGNRGILPLEEEMDTLLSSYSEILSRDETIQIYAEENFLRRFIAFRSDSRESLSEHLTGAVEFLTEPDNDEPMMNIVVWYTSPEWTVVLFPREKQRPWQYYAGDFEKIIISPAAVELGGLVILPREEDFYKLTAKDLISVYEQITLGKDKFAELKKKIIR